MARLGDICTVVSGTTPKSSCPEYWDGDLNWVTPAELNDDSDVIYESQRKITKQAVVDSSLKSFPAGTVLFSSRAPIGKVAIAGTEMYCNQGFKNLICSDAIYNRYLYHFLQSKELPHPDLSLHLPDHRPLLLPAWRRKTLFPYQYTEIPVQGT